MSKKYNFLLFCVDEMPSQCMSCTGHPDVKTPNLDKLASEGTLYSRAYCNSPSCMPSRSTMFTGLTPRQHGVLANGITLREDIPTIAGALGKAGYTTYEAGKMHLQSFGGVAGRDIGRETTKESRWAWNKGTRTSLGESYYGFQITDYVGGHGDYCFGDYGTWMDTYHPELRKKYCPVSRESLAYKLPIPAELHYNNWIADRTMDFLENIGDQPFFAWCSFPDPHDPFAAAEPYCDMYDPEKLTLNENFWDTKDPLPELAEYREQRKDFHFDEMEGRKILSQIYGMISHIDDNIGRVMKKLKELHLDENTIVMFMADHGDYICGHHLLYKTPWAYEELVRVPLIMKSPVQKEGKDCKSVVSLLDIVPTVLDYAELPQHVLDWSDYAGQKNADTRPFELPGRSLRACTDRNEPLEDKEALLEFYSHAPTSPYRESDFYGMVNERYKMVYYPEYDKGVLYDLEKDPQEMHDVYNDPAYQEIRIELTEKLLRQTVRSGLYLTYGK